MPAETSEGRLTREELLAQKESLQQSLLSTLDRIKDTSPEIEPNDATLLGIRFIETDTQLSHLDEELERCFNSPHEHQPSNETPDYLISFLKDFRQRSGKTSYDLAIIRQKARLGEFSPLKKDLTEIGAAFAHEVNQLHEPEIVTNFIQMFKGVSHIVHKIPDTGDLVPPFPSSK